MDEAPLGTVSDEDGPAFDAPGAEQPGAPEPAVPDEPTGVASVDAALDRLRDLDDTPVESHVEIFDDVQRQLHEALAELDE